VVIVIEPRNDNRPEGRGNFSQARNASSRQTELRQQQRSQVLDRRPRSSETPSDVLPRRLLLIDDHGWAVAPRRGSVKVGLNQTDMQVLSVFAYPSLIIILMRFIVVEFDRPFFREICSIRIGTSCRRGW